MNKIAPSVPPIVRILQAPETLHQLALALPRHLNAERFARVALTEVRRNPDLLSCEPASFMGALVQAAQLGLDVGGGTGQAYLIPFHNNKSGTREVQLIIGYKGLIELVRRSGMVRRLSAHVVYTGDTFDYAFGTTEFIKHIPSGETAAAKITHAYAIAEFKDGAIQMEVMQRREIDAIKDRGRINKVWNSDYGEMARKTVIRRICKFLPLSSEMAEAMTIENDADTHFATKAMPDARRTMEYQIAAADEDNQANAEREAIAEAQYERAKETEAPTQ